MRKFLLVILILSLAILSVNIVSAQEFTDVGTPRNQTMIFQTIDRQTSSPDQHNPYMVYAVWRGFRELGWGYLWEMDTGTGESYPELAASMPEVLNEEYTRFRVTLHDDVYWSDGEQFNADDIVYTLEMLFAERENLTGTNVRRIVNYVSSWEKVDDFTVDIETAAPAFDFITVMGVYTWGANFIPVPEHIFSQQENISEFRNTNPVTLGPYVVSEFDPNGFWQLWELREDWQRSAWAFLDQDGFMPQYVMYKDLGPEETRSLAFVQNQYDIDTFMSPDSVQAAIGRNEFIQTFSDQLPYHNMDDACGYGLLMNLQLPPYDMVEVRWALALMLDLQRVGINALNGEYKVSPLPMVDTQILRPIYFSPLLDWLKDFELADGYKPFNANFTSELAGVLQQVGVDESQIPADEEGLSAAFGIGWWNYDPEQAANLLTSVGFTQDGDKWLLPNGDEWVLELTIPGDWNKVMQRAGFSIADSWRQGGVNVNVRQVDNAEYGVVQNTNSQREAQLIWTNCIFNPNYLNAWHSLEAAYIQPADATEPNVGNIYQWENETVFDLIARAETLPLDSEEFYEIGREVIKHFVTDMAFINIMNIPTTVPDNTYYWTNYPTQDNYYAVPYSWWSSAKEIIANIEPTGR